MIRIANSELRRFFWIATAMLGSVVVYGLVFGWLLHKPLTIGTIRDYFTVKLERAARIQSPKIVLLGGSNVRVGLSCKRIEQKTGVPCVNAGLLADVGIDLMVEKFSPLLGRGDVVYIPLAYEQYFWSRRFVETQRDAAYLFSYDRATLLRMPLSRQMRALFRYDPPYLASAVAENLLAAAGIRRQAGGDRQFGAHNLNAWGDDTGHTRERGGDFAAVLAAAPAVPPDPDTFHPQDYYYTQELLRFLDASRERGITVIGGLPQTVDEFEIPEVVIGRLQALFRDHGQPFIVLPNRSQYPRDCFYDSLYHLNEECQRQHTDDLIPQLEPYLP